MTMVATPTIDRLSCLQHVILTLNLNQHSKHNFPHCNHLNHRHNHFNHRQNNHFNHRHNHYYNQNHRHSDTNVRRGDDDGAINASSLEQLNNGKVFVGGARRGVNQQVLQLPPVHVSQELLYHAYVVAMVVGVVV